MAKKNLIIGIIILIALVGGVVLWQQKNSQQETKQRTNKEITKQTQEQKTTGKQKTTKEQINAQKQTGNGELKLEEKIDTSDWKTYRNEKLGFEVNLPGDLNKWKVEVKKYGIGKSKYKGEEYFISFLYKNDANIPDVIPTPKNSSIHYLPKKHERLILLNVVPIKSYVKDVCLKISDPMCREGIEIGRNNKFVFLQMPQISEPLCQYISEVEKNKSDFCRVEKILSGSKDVINIIQFRVFNL